MMEDETWQLIDRQGSSVWFAAWGDDSRFDLVYPKIMGDTNDYPAYRSAQEFIERAGLIWYATCPVLETCFPLTPEEIVNGPTEPNAVWEVYINSRFHGRPPAQMPRPRPIVFDDGSEVSLSDSKIRN